MGKAFCIVAMALLLFGCQKYELEANANDQFHVQVDGAELPVLVRGNTASKKFALFINGGPGLTTLDLAEADMLGWQEDLEPSIALVYYDQRGTGNSQGTFGEESLTIEQYIKDLDAIIEVLNELYDDPQIFLMAHSFGGLIGTRYLLEGAHSGAISGWICINGSYILDTETLWHYRHTWLADIATEKLVAGEDTTKWREVLNWSVANPIIESDAQKDAWRSFVGQPGEGVVPDEAIDLPTGSVLKLMFGSSYNIFPAYLSDNWLVTLRALFSDAEGSNLLSELGSIDLPILNIWGKYDDLIPMQVGVDAHVAFGSPNADKEFALFQESGHQPFINQRQDFKREVLDFVQRY